MQGDAGADRGRDASELRPGGEAVDHPARRHPRHPGDPLRGSRRDPSAQTGWLGALRDQQIGRALALIHGDPARAWTVAALADELAMSRSAFAARFTELVGEPAMQYVTRWRMQRGGQRAARRGRHGRPSSADRLGYRSEAAFARAFKRVTGVAPGSIKREGELEIGAMALPVAG